MPHPVDVYVGKRLRMRRTILGMSQDALGNATGITFQQIQKYERGLNRVGCSRLFEFSKILSTPVSYFFEGYESEDKTGALGSGLHESNAADFEHDQIASRETLEMMRNYYRIESPLVRKRVFELIRSLVDKTEAE